MQKMLRKLGILSAIALGALAAGTSAEAAGVASSRSLQPAIDTMALIQHVQYFWDGHRWCWDDDGWNGPGWYWCGYGARRGFGWGGGYGWRGWRGGHRVQGRGGRGGRTTIIIRNGSGRGGSVGGRGRGGSGKSSSGKSGSSKSGGGKGRH